MAAVTPYNPKLLQASPAKPMSTKEAYVLGTSTYKAGQFLKIVTGLVDASTTSGATATANAIQLYALKTLDAATGNDTTIKRYGVVHEDDLWEMNEKADTIGMVKVGVEYGMDVTSNLCTIDHDNTTSGRTVLKVVQPVWNERPYQDGSTDTYARGTVNILKTRIYIVAT